MIRRPPRSTLSSSSAASDVYKRQPFSSVRSKCYDVGAIMKSRLICLLDTGNLLTEPGAPAAYAQPISRHRVPPLRRGVRERPRLRSSTADNRDTVPAGHPVRLQTTEDGKRSPAHRTMRTADQPFQREDFHVYVVLVCAGRTCNRLQLNTLALGHRASLQSDTLCA